MFISFPNTSLHIHLLICLCQRKEAHIQVEEVYCCQKDVALPKGCGDKDESETTYD